MDQSVLATWVSEPSGFSTSTATRCEVIRSQAPSTRYVVGFSGSTCTSNSPNGATVATVWLQATFSL
ncbi:hypothetical protein SMICM17S_04534 [Streptomyces microflavus]